VSSFDILTAPMTDEELEWRVQSQVGEWVRILAYVTSRAVQDRFDEAFGLFGWQVSGEQVTCGQEAGFKVGIGVLGDDGRTWLWKYDVCPATDIEAMKGAWSGALKRAGVLWGVGRELYSLGETKVQLRPGWPPDGSGAKAHKHKQTGKWTHWIAPKLGAVEQEFDRSLTRTIDALAVTALRELTGASLMHCKGALEACAGDMDAAAQKIRSAGWASSGEAATVHEDRAEAPPPTGLPPMQPGEVVEVFDSSEPPPVKPGQPAGGQMLGLPIGSACGECGSAWPCVDHPRCANCGGATWDNREPERGGKGKFGKKNPKAPDFKCRSKECEQSNNGKETPSIWWTNQWQERVAEVHEATGGAPAAPDPLADYDEVPF